MSFSSFAVEADSLVSDSILTVHDESKYQVPTITIENNIPQSKSKQSNYFDKIVPILTLLIGFFIGKFYEIVDRRITIRREGREWFENFLQLQDPLEKQINDTSTFLQENSPDSYRIKDATFQISLNCESFKSINDKSLIPFLSRKKGLSYTESVRVAGKMKNIVKIIEKISQEYSESFKILQSNSEVHYESFKKAFSEFRKYEGDYAGYLMSSENLSQKQNDIKNKLFQLSKTYVLPETRTFSLDVFKLSEEYIPKFFQVAVHDRDNEHLRKAIDALSRSDQHIMDLKTERKYLIEKLEKYKNSYQNCLNSMSSLLADL